jgi:hypothetical protein
MIFRGKSRPERKAKNSGQITPQIQPLRTKFSRIYCDLKRKVVYKRSAHLVKRSLKVLG